MSDPCSKNVGDLLVIFITGSKHRYIAEVVDENPLKLKVTESGLFANLKHGDFIILEDESLQLQGDDTCQDLLRESKEKGHPLISGLRSVRVEDDELHEILPVDNKGNQPVPVPN